MVTAIGRDSDNAYYVQTTTALAAKLGCKNMQFPGHHDVSFWMPEEFADATRRTIKENKHSHAATSINTMFRCSCVICGCDMPRNGLCMTK